MKQKLLELIAWLLFWASIFYISGVMGGLQLDTMSFKQAVIHGIIGIVVFAISALMIICLLGKEKSPNGRPSERARK